MRLERRQDPFVESYGGVGAAGERDVAPLVVPQGILGECPLQRDLQVSGPVWGQVPGGVGGQPGQSLDRVRWKYCTYQLSTSDRRLAGDDQANVARM